MDPARKEMVLSTFPADLPASTIANRQYAASPGPSPAPPDISVCTGGLGSLNEPSTLCFDAMN